MAKKRKMFKQLSFLETENIGHTGAANAVCYLSKQQDQLVSAFVDKVRISYLLDVTDSSTGGELYNNLGIIFTVTTNDSAYSVDEIVSASASRGNGGVCTIQVDRRILDNEFDPSSGFGQLQLWAETTNPQLTAGDVTLKAVIEVFGRWHAITSN